MNREQATKLINTAQALGSANNWNMLDKLLWLVDAVEGETKKSLPKGAEPVAWRFFIEDDPNMKPFWTPWTAKKEDADFAMRHFPERKYECAYPEADA